MVFGLFKKNKLFDLDAQTDYVNESDLEKIFKNEILYNDDIPQPFVLVAKEGLSLSLIQNYTFADLGLTKNHAKWYGRIDPQFESHIIVPLKGVYEFKNGKMKTYEYKDDATHGQTPLFEYDKVKADPVYLADVSLEKTVKLLNSIFESI